MPYKSLGSHSWIQFKMPKMIYKPEYCQDMVDMMAKGLSKLEIACKFDITERQFNIWLDTHEDFKNAWEVGFPKLFTWWMTEGKKKYSKNDKGMKHWTMMVQHLFKMNVEEKVQGNTININNNTLNYNGKSDQELLAILGNVMTEVNKLPIKQEPLLIEGVVIKDSDE